MPSSAVSGLKALFSISTDGGSTYSAFQEGLTATLNLNTNMIDVTNRTSSTVGTIVWDESIPVSNSWSASIDANLIDATQHNNIITNQTTHTAIKVRFARVTTTGTRMLSGDAYVSSTGLNTPGKAASSVAFSLVGIGALSVGTVP